jgi:hypothetical protein
MVTDFEQRQIGNPDGLVQMDLDTRLTALKRNVEGGVNELHGKVSKLKEIMNGLKKNVNKTEPVYDSFKLAHEANVLGDYHIIQEEIDEGTGSQRAEVWKAEFHKMYGVRYIDIDKSLPCIPRNVLEVINIWWNVTQLPEWKNLKNTNEIAVRNRFEEKSRRARDLWVKWVEGGKNETGLQEIENGCDEIVHDYLKYQILSFQFAPC